MYNEKEHIDKIIYGCKRGDRKAQEQLYKNFHDPLVSLCIRYTKCEADAKMVLNSAFLRVFKNIHQYDPEKGVLYTWIRTIVVNCCLYYLKSNNKAVSVIDINEAEEVYADADVHSKMKVEEILHFLKSLPQVTQTVFNLYVIDGYKHKEIAELLEISEGTSKWHLSEARKNLKLQIIK